MTTPIVKVYSGRLCTYCNAAKRLLDSKGATYQEILIDEDEAIRKEMEKLSGRTSVPQIFIGDTHVGGFDDLAELNREGKLIGMLDLE
jgi:glutaredoxin 3